MYSFSFLYCPSLSSPLLSLLSSAFLWEMTHNDHKGKPQLYQFEWFCILGRQLFVCKICLPLINGRKIFRCVHFLERPNKPAHPWSHLRAFADSICSSRYGYSDKCFSYSFRKHMVSVLIRSISAMCF